MTLGVYRLVQRLGEGGMGVVHLGLDPHGRAVAIKVLRAHIAYDPDARARLNREVATLSRVRHPLVAEVLDADVDGDQPFVVTRYVPGLTLDAEVRERGPMPPALLVQLGRGLSSALEAIHAAGVVHRDLKPANVLMLDGDPVVIDFGIAHVADDVRLTMTGLVMGTPGYLSPELVNGSAVTAATDWWGWAATLAFAASGQPPFGRGPADVVIDRVRRGEPDLAGVDARLRPLLRAALSPDPAAPAGRARGAGRAGAVRPRGRGDGRASACRHAARWPSRPGSWSPRRPDRTPRNPLCRRRFAARRVPSRRRRIRAPPVQPPPLAACAAPRRTTTRWRSSGRRGREQPPPPPPKPRRTGTLLAVLVALVGVGSCWPTRDRPGRGRPDRAGPDRGPLGDGRRPAAAGPRARAAATRSSPWSAAPWHLLRAVAGASVPGLVLPALLGRQRGVLRRAWPAARSRSSSGRRLDGRRVAGRGRGRAAGRRCSSPGGGRAAARSGAGRAGWPAGWSAARPSTAVVILLCLAGGCAAAYLAYTRGHPTFAPLHSLPLGITAAVSRAWPAGLR